MNIILCGLPGCGKTTYGKQLAERCSLLFIDTDRLIEEAFNGSLSCRKIYFRLGEEAFRRLEKEALHSLSGKTSSVIATGGGTLLDPENISFLKTLGTLVYLKGPPGFLFDRATQGGIPGYLAGADPAVEYLKLAASRCPLYETAAGAIVDIEHQTPEKILHLLETQVRHYLG